MHILNWTRIFIIPYSTFASGAFLTLFPPFLSCLPSLFLPLLCCLSVSTCLCKHPLEQLHSTLHLPAGFTVVASFSGAICLQAAQLGNCPRGQAGGGSGSADISRIRPRPAEDELHSAVRHLAGFACYMKKAAP